MSVGEIAQCVTAVNECRTPWRCIIRVLYSKFLLNTMSAFLHQKLVLHIAPPPSYQLLVAWVTTCTYQLLVAWLSTCTYQLPVAWLSTDTYQLLVVWLSTHTGEHLIDKGCMKWLCMNYNNLHNCLRETIKITGQTWTTNTVFYTEVFHPQWYASSMRTLSLTHGIWPCWTSPQVTDLSWCNRRSYQKGYSTVMLLLPASVPTKHGS
jgi:hypothetical protein